MNFVICFSPTYGTLKIAQYVSNYSKLPLVNLTSYKSRLEFDYNENYETIIFCFPVYSQNIPLPVKDILRRIKTKYVIFLATYGRMSMGNVLYEASKIIDSIVIGGAYIPTKHTYKLGEYFNDYNKLNPILNRVNESCKKSVKIPHLPKNLFSNLFPNFRSRVGVKLKRTNNCQYCNKCREVCPTNAIKNGIIDNKCIRCLSCYYNCPTNGLTLKYNVFMKVYLKKDKTNQLYLY